MHSVSDKATVDKKHKEYLATPEGQAATKAAKEKKEEKGDGKKKKGN